MVSYVNTINMLFAPSIVKHLKITEYFKPILLTLQIGLQTYGSLVVQLGRLGLWAIMVWVLLEEEVKKARRSQKSSVLWYKIISFCS